MTHLAISQVTTYHNLSADAPLCASKPLYVAMPTYLLTAYRLLLRQHICCCASNHMTSTYLLLRLYLQPLYIAPCTDSSLCKLLDTVLVTV